MKVVHVNYEDKFELEESAACIGYFDGMHLGHMQLVKAAILEAKEKKIKSACITFEPDPWVVIKNMQDIPHITSMEERIKLGEDAGLDYWIIISFTKQLAGLSTSDFEKMLASMNVKTLVCGFDYSYGAFGAGNIKTLRQQNMFDVIEVDEVLYENEKISSTRIEKSILNGDMKQIVHLLGRPYSVKGKVVHGSSLGNTIGYPTANISLKHNYVIPSGVFIGYVSINGKYYKSMINFGHNPTFNYSKNISIEAFILDFNCDIYEQEIQLILIEKIRDEIKFEDSTQLIEQLNKDVRKAQKLNEYTPNLFI